MCIYQLNSPSNENEAFISPMFPIPDYDIAPAASLNVTLNCKNLMQEKPWHLVKRCLKLSHVAVPVFLSIPGHKSTALSPLPNKRFPLR